MGELDDIEKRLDDFVHAAERSPAFWAAQERLLWRAATVLDREHIRGARTLDRKLAEVCSFADNYLPLSELRLVVLAREKQALFQVAAMLRAVSIECLLKGAVYSKRIKETGHGRHVDRIKSAHSFRKLIDELGLTVNDEDKRQMAWLMAMLQLGRYPVHKDGITSKMGDPTGDRKLRAKLRRQLKNRNWLPK